MATLIIITLVVLGSYLILSLIFWLCDITDSSNSLIHNNRYNKYKIYYDGDGLYYCKMVTSYILGIIPIWKKVKYSVPSGFEDSTYHVWYEDDLETIKLEMDKSYTEYCKRKNQLKTKARTVYKSYE